MGPPNSTLPADATSHPAHPATRCTLSPSQLAAARAHPPPPPPLDAGNPIRAPAGVRAHGAAMAAAFLVLLPLGAAAAAPPRDDAGGTWLPTHRRLQLGGVVAAGLGLAGVLSHNTAFLPSHFSRDPHGYYGLAVLVATAVQAATGLIRPAPGGRLRGVWVTAHRLTAAAIAGGSWVALLTGIRSVAWVYGYPAAGVSALVVAGGVVGVAAWLVAAAARLMCGAAAASGGDAPYESVEVGGVGGGDDWAVGAVGGRGERGGAGKAEWGVLATALWWSALLFRAGGGGVVVGWVLLARGRV